MRFLLLIFALVATPALARQLPPEQPTYEKPTFERPSTPSEPKRKMREEEREQPTFTPKPKPAACPSVKCITGDDGKRRAMFTADIPKEMYHLGRNFCAKVPKHITEVTACCLAKDHKYQIVYSAHVGKKAHYKAKKFCTCVHGLD